MALTSLVVCSDESTTQVLRRILEDLGIAVQYCQNASDAEARLAQTRFDWVVIDCENEPVATEILRKARLSPANASTLAVAIAGKENNVRQMFAMGINFVLYKPVSEERAASSFRAARSLMTRERRRTGRVAAHGKVALDYANVENAPATLIDLSEEGSAVQSERRLPPDCRVYFQFALPGHTSLIRLSGEVVWQDSAGRVGVRFVSVPTSSRRVLRTWLQSTISSTKKQTPLVPRSAPPIVKTTTAPGQGGIAADSGIARLRSSPGNRRGQSRHACRLSADVFRMGVAVPNRCSLTDISAGGCYVEMPTPFSSGTRVEIIVRTHDLKLRTQGVVQSVHRGFGMGVQLTLTTQEDRDQVESLIRLLAQSGEESELGPVTDPWAH
jgi:CheY-like chemotaxis protein